MAEPARILIVDDEPFNVDYLEQELDLLGYETESAFTGREALERVAERAPDLILLDIMMPDIDGFTVCRMLKDDRRTRLIPIVIMTSLNDTEDRIKGIEAGADDFLSKPVNDRELLARIKTALRLKRAVDHEIGELRKTSDHLAKFVPDAVNRLVAANPAAPDLQKREHDVSVLFADISGYTRLSEKIAPEVLNLLVERYFSSFLDRIHESDGEVSETSGDGLMAIFQDGDPRRHAVKAVDTALAMLDANESLNRENSIQPLAIHIGVNSGPALVGSTKFQGQRGVRWVFTADGPVINLAARLADIAKEGEIVAGPETIHRLGDRYPLLRLGSEPLKNITESVEMFRVLGPPSVKTAPRRVAVAQGLPQPEVQRRLGTVLAAEIVAPGVAEPRDDAQAERLDGLEGLVAEYRGGTIERDAAGLIAEFGSPAVALSCAAAMQRALGAPGEDAASGPAADLRIGIGIGSMALEGGRLTGDGVALAIGLRALARPGEIRLTEVVRDNAGQDFGGAFEDLGEQRLDGVSRPVQAYRLRTSEGVVAPEGRTAMAEVSAAKSDEAPGARGLPWPMDYGDLKPRIHEAWGIGEELYLNRVLSGKSGALVYAVDVTSRGFGGQAILKLDRLPDPDWSEAEESARHRRAIEANPEYAAEHLPSIVHTCRHGGQIAILSTIAARGLEYARPWAECSYDRQLATVRRLSRELLEDWNGGYAFGAGMQGPSDLLQGWLAHRLDPAQGRIHAFLSEDCGIGTREPAFMFEGHWYPNPIAFAERTQPLPEGVQLRAVTGNVHGDLHGFNVLVKSSGAETLAYYLIDLALYKAGQYLFYDHAYFEFSYLLHLREAASLTRFRSILDALGGYGERAGRGTPSGDDLGLTGLLEALRREEFDWIERHEPNRLSYLESQRMLARVAVGLNFVNKRLSRKGRCMALIYGANSLKHYLKFHGADWPKHGRSLRLGDGNA